MPKRHIIHPTMFPGISVDSSIHSSAAPILGPPPSFLSIFSCVHRSTHLPISPSIRALSSYLHAHPPTLPFTHRPPTYSPTHFQSSTCSPTPSLTLPSNHHPPPILLFIVRILTHTFIQPSIVHVLKHPHTHLPIVHILTHPPIHLAIIHILRHLPIHLSIIHTLSLPPLSLSLSPPHTHSSIHPSILCAPTHTPNHLSTHPSIRACCLLQSVRANSSSVSYASELLRSCR